MTDTKENKSTFVQRFGTLVDVTPRETQAGDEYVTFSIDCGEFTQIGAAFNEDVVASLKGAVGNNIWVKGPMEPRTYMKDGEQKEGRSFKAIYFKDLTKSEAEEAKEEMAEAA